MASSKSPLKALHPPYDDHHLFCKSSIKLRPFSTRYRKDLPLVLEETSLPSVTTAKWESSTGQAPSSKPLPDHRTLGRQCVCGGWEMVECLGNGLHSLRQSLLIIHQSPFLFRGSIVSGIYPFYLNSKEEVWSWSVLKEYVQSVDVELSSFRTDSTPSSPRTLTSSGGWQEQLMCQARALI